jgi:hypothetical protein
MRAMVVSASPVLWTSATLPPWNHSQTITAAFPATAAQRMAAVAAGRSGRAPGRGKGREP